MTIFGWFRKKKKISPEVASQIIFTEVRLALIEELFVDDSDVGEDIFKKINGILYFTKAATVIQWIRIVLRNCKGTETWNEILERFEKKIFPSNPLEGLELVEYVNELISSTIVLQEIISSIGRDASIENEIDQRIRTWAEGWLDPASPDKELIKRVAFLHGHMLALEVANHMKKVGGLMTQISQRI
jgi:hypothetical protein